MAVFARATELLLKEHAGLIFLKLCTPLCVGKAWFIGCLKFMLHDLGGCKKKGNGIKGISFGLPQPHHHL